MKIHYQCSNCGQRFQSSAMVGVPDGMYISGCRATFRISYTDNVYSINEIINIINLAGFGLGIGSGRTSGYGRYHVIDVK